MAPEPAPASAQEESFDHQSDLQSLLRQIPYKKLLIWATVAGALYSMKDFFGVGGALESALAYASPRSSLGSSFAAAGAHTACLGARRTG